MTKQDVLNCAVVCLKRGQKQSCVCLVGTIDIINIATDNETKLFTSVKLTVYSSMSKPTSSTIPRQQLCATCTSEALTQCSQLKNKTCVVYMWSSPNTAH